MLSQVEISQTIYSPHTVLVLMMLDNLLSSMSVLSPTWLSDGKQDAGTMITSWIINRIKHAVDVIPGMMLHAFMVSRHTALFYLIEEILTFLESKDELVATTNL
jgi:hypothetical protein